MPIYYTTITALHVVLKIWRRSLNYKSRSCVPFTTPFDLIFILFRRKSSSFCLPNLMFLASTVWFGSRANLQKIATADLSLLIDGNVIHRVDSVRDLAVTLDSELTLQRHVNKVASLCFHHIRRLKQVCKLLGPGVATTLVSAFVLSRLDYCNAILAGLPKTTIAPLQRAQNAVARLVAQLGPRDHVSNALRDLHWLPVQQRITYKLCLLMHLVHNDRAPVYLADSVTATANISRRIRLTVCQQSATSSRELGSS